MEHIKNALFLATLAAQSLHGRCAVRLDTSYYLDIRTRTFMIDAEDRISCDIARIFTGFLADTIGDDKFSIKMIEGRIPSLPHFRIDGI